jgi:hypothetical protein
MSKDLFPGKGAEFYAMQSLLMANLLPRCAQLGISEVRKTKLVALQGDYEGKYAIAENPATRTPVAIAEFKDAYKRYKDELREDLRGFVTHNPDVTDGDRRAMGLPVYDKKPTPVPAPTTIPELEMDISKPQRLTVRFREQGSRSRAKPKGTHGVEIKYVLRDTAIEDPNTPEETFVLSAFFTRSPAVLEFTPEQRGKFFCARARWENTTGKKGLLGEIVCVRVP